MYLVSSNRKQAPLAPLPPLFDILSIVKKKVKSKENSIERERGALFSLGDPNAAVGVSADDQTACLHRLHGLADGTIGPLSMRRRDGPDQPSSLHLLNTSALVEREPRPDGSADVRSTTCLTKERANTASKGCTDSATKDTHR
jgi:hypothetical protein